MSRYDSGEILWFSSDCFESCLFRDGRQYSLMAFASKDIEFGDGERRNDLYIITKNKDSYPTTRPCATWGGDGKEMAITSESFRKPFIFS